MAVQGVWPRGGPRPSSSHAEAKLYRALAAGLPDGWCAWHSLRLRVGARYEGEGDFVLAIPGRGLLVLEVKGGAIAVVDGRWLQNGREMSLAPREQGHRFVRELVAALARDRAAPPAYGVATCFPDTPFDREPAQGDVHDAVLGERDLGWIGPALLALADRVLPPPTVNAAGPHAWIDRIHEIWGHTWRPHVALGHRAAMEAERRIELDAQQLELLDCIEPNERMLVEGPAGTGKTLLARDAALRLAEGGRRVLLLCFTDALATWLRDPTPGVTVATLRRYAQDLLERAGAAQGPPDWENVALQAAADAMPGELPDAVVLDEAQDFSAGDWLLVEQLAAGRRLWAFFDPAQAFWPDRRIPEALFSARFQLRHAYRCPPGVRALADRCIGRAGDEALVRAAIEQGALALVACPSATSVPDKIAVEIGKLRSEGLRPGDIAIVSVRGQTPAESILRREHLSETRLVRADDPAMEHEVVADTFLRIKGLERPAVIVTDLHLLGPAPDRAGVRLHIALTRALVTARIVDERECLRREPVLARLVG